MSFFNKEQDQPFGDTLSAIKQRGGVPKEIDGSSWADNKEMPPLRCCRVHRQTSASLGASPFVFLRCHWDTSTWNRPSPPHQPSWTMRHQHPSCLFLTHLQHGVWATAEHRGWVVWLLGRDSTASTTL